MDIRNLSFPSNFVLQGDSEWYEQQLIKCYTKINDEKDLAIKFKYIVSWCRSIEQLINLGSNSRNTGTTIHSDFAEFSFCWTACGMHGGLIFHEDSGWQLHS